MSAASSPVYGGIDVSKARLDVHVLPQGIAFSVENSPAGSMQLQQKLQPMQVAMVVLEATGRYQRRVAADLLSHDIPVAVVNPRRRVILPGAWASWPRPMRSMPRHWRDSPVWVICGHAKSSRKMRRFSMIGSHAAGRSLRC